MTLGDIGRSNAWALVSLALYVSLLDPPEDTEPALLVVVGLAAKGAATVGSVYYVRWKGRHWGWAVPTVAAGLAWWLVLVCLRRRDRRSA